jgi:hypothetical protein
MFRSASKLAIGVALATAIGVGTAVPALAKVPTIPQVTAASFYNCYQADDWTMEPSNWKLRYKKKVKGAWIVRSSSVMGYFEVSVKPGRGGATVKPNNSLSKKIWKMEGCSRKYSMWVNYSYTDSLFNNGGPMD